MNNHNDTMTIEERNSMEDIDCDDIVVGLLHNKDLSKYNIRKNGSVSSTNETSRVD